MNAWTGKLPFCRLFTSLSEDAIDDLLRPEQCMISRCKKQAVLFQEGESMCDVGIVLEGMLSIYQLSLSGESVKIQRLIRGDCFGLAMLFSPNPRCPYTIAAATPATVLYVPFVKIDEMMQKSDAVRRNAFCYLSERIAAHQGKIRILSQRSVRGRLLLYLAQQAKTGTNRQSFALNNSKTEIADLLGVARPSLCREIRRMQADGLLLIDKTDRDHIAAGSIRPSPKHTRISLPTAVTAPHLGAPLAKRGIPA